MTLPTPRRGTPEDAEELTRLHVEAGIGRSVDEAWRSTHRDDLTRRLAEARQELIVFVIDAPEGAGLASASVGFIHSGLCHPANPNGLLARLSSVTTDLAYRRRGYATAVTRAFLNDVRSRGCPHVSLDARTGVGDLYRSPGFASQTNTMTLGLN